MKTKINTLADYLFWEPMLTPEKRAALSKVPCPSRILGAAVPETLDSLSFEALARFWDCKTPAELYAVAADVILHKSPGRVLRAKALPLIGLGNMLVAELSRITDLWNGLQTNHTSDEIMAGCNRLNFGVFGIADWYARRMGITDHDVAMATPWVRIFQCMSNDAAEQEYQRRLNEIIANKHK